MDRRHDERARAIDAVRAGLDMGDFAIRRARRQVASHRDGGWPRAVYNARHRPSEGIIVVPVDSRLDRRDPLAREGVDELVLDLTACLLVDSPAPNGWWPEGVERPEWATPGSRDGWMRERTAA